MHMLKSKARLAGTSLVLAAVALSGCHMDPNEKDPITLVTSHTFDHANWQQLPRPLGNQVEPITVVHPVTFDDGETEMGEGEVARLVEFLQQSRALDGGRIEIDGPRDKAGYHDPLTAARLSAIEAELSSFGLRGEIPARPITSLVKPEDGIAVTVTRAMVILPDCSTPQPDFATRPSYTASCANAAALGMMVADPLDLERGRASGPADGEAATLSIQRYRKGDTKPLEGSGF